MSQRSIYLDNAATTPLSPEVFETMRPFMEQHFGNPSSTHAFGRKTKTAIERSRRTIASSLNCLPAEIYFMSGGTEADNIALRCSVEHLGCTHIITSAIEHSAVIKTAQLLEHQGAIRLSLVHLKDDGHVDLDHLAQLLDTPDKTLVTLMHGNNEIGNLLPLKQVGDMCAAQGALFHSDTVQTMGHFPFDLNDINIDFITGAGHKFHGPKGVGFLYMSKDLKVKAMITGGGQEREMRGGTENLYGIVGIGKALDLCTQDMDAHRNHISGLKQHMARELESRLPGVEFNGDSRSEDSLYTVLNLTLPESQNAGMMLFLLDLEGIACSGGSACSSGAAKGSHVLTAIDAIKPNRASLRFSFSRFTTREEIDYAVEKVVALCSVKETA